MPFWRLLPLPLTEEIANAVEVKEDEHYTRARTRVRSALAEHRIAAQLERLVGEVFRGA